MINRAEMSKRIVKRSASESGCKRRHGPVPMKKSRCAATLVSGLMILMKRSNLTTIQPRQMSWLRPMASMNLKRRAASNPWRTYSLQLMTRYMTQPRTFADGYWDSSADSTTAQHTQLENWTACAEIYFVCRYLSAESTLCMQQTPENMTECSETIQSCISYELLKPSTELLTSLRAKSVAWLRSCMTARVGVTGEWRKYGRISNNHISTTAISYKYDPHSYRMNGCLKPEL